MESTFTKIKPLLNTGQNRVSRFLGYLGLLTGVVLLLVSIQMFYNIQWILKENNQRKTGYDYISVSKVITNENMGRDNRFTAEELRNIRSQPFIVAVSPLTTNQYQIKATAGSLLAFSTDLFLESLDDSFLDTLPANYSWKPGEGTVPLILSSDFLELYNVFAPAQGLPQVSPKTVSSVPIFLECSGPGGSQTFKGQVVALSDRVSSFLAPESFLKWSNEYFSGDSGTLPSRIFIKIRDANDPQFLSFLDSNHYHVNKEKIKYGRIKSILQNVVVSLGVFGILVILLALLLFSFYIQLMLSKSKENLNLLLTLGYSPAWLARGMTRTWVPLYASVVLIALTVTQLLQFLFVQLPFVQSSDPALLVHWTVFAMAIILFTGILLINRRTVKKELMRVE